MVLSYSFMAYVCEDMPIRDLGVKHENLGLYPKGNNGRNQINSRMNERLG